MQQYADIYLLQRLCNK